jgi:enamine deaminase RidA (YjgF/YER057c/UK114 family)
MKKTILKTPVRAPEFLNDPIEYNKSFSRGVRVFLNDTEILFISGTASIDKKGNSLYAGNFSAQVKRTFENIAALLKSEGASWHDIVQTRCYLRDMRDYQKFNEIRNAFYKKHKLLPFPASVCIQANLCRAELLIEIEAIAIVRKTK